MSTPRPTDGPLARIWSQAAYLFLLGSQTEVLRCKAWLLAQDARYRAAENKLLKERT